MRSAHAMMTPETRHHMVEEAAYYRAQRRGFSPGGELADWLEAEAEVDEMLSTAQGEEASGQEERIGSQEGGPKSIARQDKLERLVREHPQRDEPRRDSVEPDELRGQ